MPTFIAIGYGDVAGYEKTARHIRDRAHEHDAHLRRDGARMWTAGTPVKVRNTEGEGTSVERGAFMAAP